MTRFSMVTSNTKEVFCKQLLKDKVHPIHSANHTFQRGLHLVDRETKITDNNSIQMYLHRIRQTTTVNFKLICPQNNCSLSPWTLVQMGLRHQDSSNQSLEHKR